MEKSFEISDGARIAYTDVGEGPALVFVPGWSQSAAMFRHQIRHFARTHRVLALDHRGHGASPRARGGYRIHRLAADLMELLDHEGVGRATLVGWSMGASVVWAAIDLFGTGRIERLVFLDEPACVARQPGMSENDALEAGALFDLAAMAGIADRIAGPDGAAARGGFLASMLTRNIPEDLKGFLHAENMRVDARDVASLFVNHCSIDWRDVLARIDRPTLVIGGRASHVDPRSQEWIHAQIPGAKLVIFEEEEGGAHFPFIEAPEVFNEVLSRFLAS